MKIFNFSGMTPAERMEFLQQITQDIYNHLYDDYIWTVNDVYNGGSASYKYSQLIQYNGETDSVKSGQIVYFAQNGYVAVINQINSDEETFTTYGSYQIMGPRGPQGYSGTPLTTNAAYETYKVPISGDSITVPLNTFNYSPNTGTKYLQVMYGTSAVKGRSWLCLMSVTSVNADSSVTSSVLFAVETTGEQGESALGYNNIVNIGSVPVASASFNVVTNLCSRTPVIGDIFLCILRYQNRTWLASCRIVKKVDDNNYTAVISFLQESTGEKGPQGPRGYSETPLTTNAAYGIYKVPISGDSITVPLNTFNYSPKTGTQYLQVMYGTSAVKGRSWLCLMSVTSVIADSSVTSSVLFAVETTGEQGPQGPAGSFDTGLVKRYLHIGSISSSVANLTIYYSIFSSSETIIDSMDTFNEVYQYDNAIIPVSGFYHYDNVYNIFAMKYLDSSIFELYYVNESGSIITVNLNNDEANYVDTVIDLGA